MASLGRFDIYYPDGRVDNVHLTGDRATVGRAADNTIVLHGDSIADYHFELRVESGVAHLINRDATHGTRVSGKMVRDSRPHPIVENAEIDIGSLRFVFRAGSDQPTVAMTPLSDSTQIVQPTLDVTLDRSLIEVFPASSASAAIHITNRLTSAEHFLITLDGLPEGWAKLSQTTVLLDGGESQTVHLVITPPRRADNLPTDYPVTIAVKSAGDVGREQRLSSTVRLRAFAGLSVAMDPPVIDGGKSFRLFLLNQGNAELRLSLRPDFKGADLVIDLPQNAVVLNAGQRVQVAGSVAGKRTLVGKTRAVPFALLLQAENASKFLIALPATVVLRPRVSTRVLAAVAVFVVTIAAILTAALTQRPPPAISSFELSALQVARGTPVALRWQAEAADRYVIEVDRIAIAELPGDTSEFIFGTDQHVDAVEIALIAVQGEQKAIETRDVVIYQPASIHSFSTSRGDMWRNVSDRLVIEWQVEGAVSLDVTFPEAFDAIYDERADDGSGRIVLFGAPLEDFDLTLSSEDELGTIVERRIGIRILDPECTPFRDTPVFTGPDARFEQAQLAIENVPVLVRGINESNDWLKLELANGESGWGFRGGFSCQSFDPDALQVITDVPLLPTSTATATATPTSTATETIPAPTSTPSATATLPLSNTQRADDS